MIVACPAPVVEAANEPNGAAMPGQESVTCSPGLKRTHLIVTFAPTWAVAGSAVHLVVTNFFSGE